MSSLGASLGVNFSGQLFARMISFGINMYLLRVIDNSVLGLVNVRLTLLYNTILFLVREPMRKANILKSSIPQFINLLWVSPLICLVVAICCTTVWELLSSSAKDMDLIVLLSFPLATFIESLGEPFAVVALRFSMPRHFAIGQSLLIFLQRIFVLILLFASNLDHLRIFAFSQVLSSSVYLLFHVVSFMKYSSQSLPELSAFSGFSSFLPQPSQGVDRESIHSLTTVFGHSIIKQLLTDGSGYVMTFTDALSLKNQAVYDAVERLGSLFARIVLNPLEESCFAYFSNAVNQQSKVFGTHTESHDSMIRTFSTTLHICCVTGMVVTTFGIPYSKLAVWLYGGHLLYDNGGGLLLSLYSFYVFVMAINGITECFAFATMNNKEVFSHGGFLFASAVAHLSLNAILCYYYAAAGFIMANCINMIIRIVYSWRHIRSFLGERTPSVWVILPSLSVVVFLGFTLFATVFSQLLFGSTPGLSHTLAHVAIGAVLLILLLFHIVQYDPVFQRILYSLTKQD